MLSALLPITSSTTEAVWGWMRTLLWAVQVTTLPWSSALRSVMSTVLVTRPGDGGHLAAAVWAALPMMES